jgi:hypothetical protein
MQVDAQRTTVLLNQREAFMQISRANFDRDFPVGRWWLIESDLTSLECCA